MSEAKKKVEVTVGTDIKGCRKEDDGSYTILNSFGMEIGKLYPGERADAYAAFLGAVRGFVNVVYFFKHFLWRMQWPDYRKVVTVMKKDKLRGFDSIYGQIMELDGKLLTVEKEEDDEDIQSI